MQYNGVYMECDGDTSGYPYNLCTCTIDYVTCSDSSSSTSSDDSSSGGSSNSGSSDDSSNDSSGGSSDDSPSGSSTGGTTTFKPSIGTVLTVLLVCSTVIL